MDKLLKTMMDDSPIAYFYIKGIKDDYGIYNSLKVLDVNKSFSVLFNVDLKNIINKRISEDILLSKVPKFNELLQRSIDESKYTTNLYLEDENLHLNLDVYSGGNDKFSFRISKIKEESMKFKSILRYSPFYTWIKDKHGRYVDVNEAYLELVNKSYDEVIGKTSHDIFGKENGNTFTQRDYEVLKENKLIVYDAVYYSSQNKIIHTEENIWPYKDYDNNILGTIGVSMDVTYKKNLLKNIKKNEEFFLDVAGNIEDVLIIKEGENITYISPSFEKVFEDEPNKLLNGSDCFMSYFDDDDLEMSMKYDYSKPYDAKARLKTNHDKWLWIKSVPVKDDEEHTLKRICIISDISNSKKLERELDNLRMDFFANLSHELRTPINLVLSSIQLINIKLNNIPSPEREFLDKYLKIITQNGLRLLKLVNNLIDTTKIDAGQFKYHPQNYNIISFVEDICTSVVDFVESNSLKIIFDTNVEEKIIAFDLDNIERIILNLISNAIKFNKPDGTIEVTIDCQKDVKISVKDSGLGIPNDKIGSVFGRFEQVTSKIKKEREGSGIGLSLVKSLVEINGGIIELFSEVDKGSEFIITLPDRVLDMDEEKSFVKKHNSSQKCIDHKTNRMNVEFSDIYS